MISKEENRENINEKSFAHRIIVDFTMALISKFTCQIISKIPTWIVVRLSFGKLKVRYRMIHACLQQSNA